MIRKRDLTLILLAVVPGWMLFGDLTWVRAQGTAFTFQGKLSENGVPAANSYDMQFKLFDTENVETGTQQGSTITVPGVVVSNGVFNTTLDFGITVFNGSPRYLEIGVRRAGSANPYALLDPRQPILSSPYAMRSLTASQADGLSVSCMNCITASNMADGAVTAGKIAPQQVVKSIGGLRDDVGITAGPGISIVPANNTLTISSVPLPAPPPLTRLTLAVPGVTGGNPDGSIELYSASSGLQRQSGSSAVFANLKVIKGIDRASYKLQQAAAAGTPYATVTLNFYSIDPVTMAQTLTLRLTIGNSLVRLIQPSFSAPQDISAAREDLEFSFSVIKWEYLIPGMPSVTTCWNLQSQSTQCSGV